MDLILWRHAEAFELASPARRAQQTAAALERKVRTVPELAPDAGVDALLHAARWPDAREPVLQVVVHAVMSPELL